MCGAHVETGPQDREVNLPVGRSAPLQRVARLHAGQGRERFRLVSRSRITKVRATLEATKQPRQVLLATTPTLHGQPPCSRGRT